MSTPQPAILAPVPAFARHLFFQLAPGADPRPALARLAAREIGLQLAIGLGPSLVTLLEGAVPGLHELPALSGPGVSAPSTPVALWIAVRADDAGGALPLAREVVSELEGTFELERSVDGFKYRGGRDLTGFVDGTENPVGDDAERAAIVRTTGPGLDGGSFVAIQRWSHRLSRFYAMPAGERDLAIGRRLAQHGEDRDEEIEDAPASAHVKRTAQESFEPEAFVVRRSMPFAGEGGEGLLFIAFGASLDAFEAQLRRMLGLEDGIVDALFRFTRPLDGCALWCPPLDATGRLDLRAVGVTR